MGLDELSGLAFLVNPSTMAKQPREVITHDELVARARAAVASSQLTQLQISERVGVSRPVIARALNEAGTRDTATLIAIMRELADEEWEKQTVFVRW